LLHLQTVASLQLLQDLCREHHILTAVGSAATKDNVPSKRVKDEASSILTSRTLTPQQKKEEIKNLLKRYDVNMDVLEKVGLW
jgi:hypothetical protein